MNDLEHHDDPTVRALARTARDLRRKADMYRLADSVELLGEEASRRLALAYHTAARAVVSAAKEIAE